MDEEMKGAEEKRQCERMGQEGRFRYCLSVHAYLESRLIEADGLYVDVCRHGRGIGFITEFPIEPGHVLRLKDSGSPAVVKWVSDAGGQFRAGAYVFV